MIAERWRYTGFLTLLIISALLLTARLIYLYLANAVYFPINTVQIAATYEHITRKELEGILANYLNTSFFSLPIQQLQTDLNTLSWANKVSVERVWPDTLKIMVQEKVPVAIWNDSLMTENGQLFGSKSSLKALALPRLSGPLDQQTEVLQIFEKLSKLLAIYGLHAASLQLRDNQAWELSLSNGVLLRLGKRDLEKRLQRFCRAYPTVFAEKPEQVASVDLRYARGMAVQWKETSN